LFVTLFLLAENCLLTIVMKHTFLRMASAAEAYDLILSKFLETMISRSDANNTILVVRAVS
jgi:hypothetical protein